MYEQAQNIQAEAENNYQSAISRRETAESNLNNISQSVKSAYVNDFSSVIQAVGTKEDNLNHHVANCQADEQVITYNNDIFCAYRLDVDADNSVFGDRIYSFNGHKVAFRLHTAPKDLHLRYYDTSSRYYPKESMTYPVLFGWEHQILHYSYESYESDVGVNIYPLLDTKKKNYEIWDTITQEYKTFECFSRSGTGGNSVNNINNISTLVQLIFYVERDDEQLNTWSAVGQTSIVNYVNMYNMGTGTTFHPQQHNTNSIYGCYDLWRRRMEITPWNPVINDEDNEWTEVWGFGGYPGIAFSFNLKDDLTSLRSRVVV